MATEPGAGAAGVLVVAELRGGWPADSTYELLGAAAHLREHIPGPVTALLIGAGVEGVAADLVARGADRVAVVESGALVEYEPEAYGAVVQQAVAALRPALVLFAHTALGRDLAPRVAFQFSTALLPDCVEVRPEDRGFAMVRPVSGGKFLAVMRWRRPGPLLATLRVKTFAPMEPDPGRSGEVQRLEVAPPALRARVIRREVQAAAGTRLEDAEVIISGGRGVGAPEGFRDLERLAALFGGAVGASRAAVDAGWIDPSHQVGMTGKTVKPRLYVAIGISGASAHMAGCAGAGTVVAINTDPTAPIFDWAHYGIVADWRNAVPALTDYVARVLA